MIFTPDPKLQQWRIMQYDVMGSMERVFEVVRLWGQIPVKTVQGRAPVRGGQAAAIKQMLCWVGDVRFMYSRWQLISTS